MKLLNDLLYTDYGLMSLVVITITLCMGVFFVRLFVRKMNDSAAQAARSAPRPAPGARG